MKDACLRKVFTIGIVRKPYGLSGVFRVQSLGGETAHFAVLRELTLQGPEARKKIFPVEECKIAGQDILVKVRGINSPEEAALYKGWEILAPREAASPLRAGEYYITDLCGCDLVYDTKTVGKVKSVLETGAHDMLEVVDGTGKTFMIPFVDVHVGDVDIENRRVQLKSEWLLE